MLVASIFLVSYAVMTWLGYSTTTRILDQRIRENLESHAAHSMDKIDRLLYERIADLNLISTDRVISSRISSPEQITARLNEYQRNHPVYSSLSFYHLNRIRIAGTSVKGAGKRYDWSEYWPDITAGKDSVMTVARSNAADEVVVYFAMKVRDGKGSRFGVVAARMPIDGIHDIVKQSFFSSREKETLKVELLTSDGDILYSSYDPEGMLKEQSEDWPYISGLLRGGKNVGSARHVFKGEEEFTAFAREQGFGQFKGNGWILTLCMPLEVVFADAYKQGSQFGVLFAGIGLIVLFVTFLASRTAVKPVHELSLAAAEIGKGNLEVAVRVRSKDEIGMLARAFNTMARDLRESEKKFRDLAELLPQIVFETDAKGNYLFANRYAFEISGYTPDDLSKGLNAAQLFIPEDRMRAAQNLQRRMAGEEIGGVEYTALARDGRTFPVLLYATPVMRENTVVGIRGIAIDISERKKAENELRESEEKLRTITQTAQDAIVMMDENGNISFWNPSAERIFGHTRSEALGKELHILIGPSKYHDAYRTGFARFRKTGEGPAVGRKIELTGVRKDGTEVQVELSLSAIESRGTWHAVGIIRDITERKLIEKKIRELNEELEGKVRERTKQLLAAQEELVRKEKLSTLGQIAGSVGHELRNPLGVMNNAVYFLQAVLSGADETVKEYLCIIKSEISGAERIVSDLLDAVRTKAPQRQEVRTEALIAASLEKCRIPKNVNVETNVETEHSVFVDPLQMKQVFINLICNAVDAMPNGGVLRISARTIADCGMRNAELSAEDSKSEIRNPKCAIEISVEDTGCGIPPESMNKLFQPLFTTKARGIGLGLVVVKNLTEANGGSVRVSSEAGRGTTFIIAIPAATA